MDRLIYRYTHRNWQTDYKEEFKRYNIKEHHPLSIDFVKVFPHIYMSIYIYIYIFLLYLQNHISIYARM